MIVHFKATVIQRIYLSGIKYNDCWSNGMIKVKRHQEVLFIMLLKMYLYFCKRQDSIGVWVYYQWVDTTSICILNYLTDSSLSSILRTGHRCQCMCTHSVVYVCCVLCLCIILSTLFSLNEVVLHSVHVTCC